ncbi:hypothetical protein HDU93_003201 [Gonapodya sp. JEL0774]|nr:hypothetical protein HDU93_003201 [Gonapodya sp. JEL0774]
MAAVAAPAGSATTTLAKTTSRTISGVRSTTRATSSTPSPSPVPGAGKKCVSPPRTQLTIMSFNIYDGGSSLKKTAEAIRAVGADIVGLQEVHAEGDPCTADICDPANDTSVAKPIADLVGFKYVYEQKKYNEAIWANAIISRFPLCDPTPNDLGVKVLVDGRKVWAFNLHLDDAPYQPYQALGIEYGDWPYTNKTDELICWATTTRGGAIKLLENDLRSVAADADAVLLFGDFNEPSHLDWTEPAVKAGLQPLVVQYPTSRAMNSLGFVDTFRAKFPDVVAKPGITYTPDTEPTDPTDHHDRIDFAYVKSKTLIVHDAGVVGEKKPDADVVVTPWPSDHRSVFARISF